MSVSVSVSVSVGVSVSMSVCVCVWRYMRDCAMRCGEVSMSVASGSHSIVRSLE